MDLNKRFHLEGKTALVTGAGRGLGRGFAEALAEAGADVAVADIDKESAEETQCLLEAKGRRSLAIAADISQKSDICRMVSTVTDAWERLDIAVNNVGIAPPIKPTLDVTEEEWDTVVDVNLRGTFFCAQAEAAVMVAQGYGKIINIASICGRIVWPDPQSVYSISKAGIVHLTRCLGAEWIKNGIRVNCISPGVTRTPELFPEVIPVFLRTAPIDHVAEVADMQGAVLFLASALSDFMVGQELVLDGGYTIM